MARVLIIEDNPDNLELMRYLLENFGHQTSSATDGLAGIRLACAEQPDLVVCDIQMQGADGYAVARALKSDPALAGTPLVAVTALAMMGDCARVLAAGFDSYISKPIDPQRFVADIEALMAAGTRGRSGPSDEVDFPLYTPAPGFHAHVLVVDDAASNRELMRVTLQPFGFELSLAHSVDVALEMAALQIPDLIVSDLHMPGSDGFALVKRVKADEQLRHVPFILLSSSSWNVQDRERAHALGVDRFLLRPIEPAALIAQIESCLRPR